jgi:hypothetical protein
MNELLSLTSAQLKQAAEIKEKIDALEQEFASLVGSSPVTAAPTPVVAKRGRPKKVVDLTQPVSEPAKRKMSAAGRARIIAAQKARWAKTKAEKNGNDEAKPVVKPAKKRKMSAAGKAAIIAAQKARWAKVKAAKKG